MPHCSGAVYAATSHDRNPSHTYDDNGAYTVSLTATAADGVDVMMKTWYVEVGDVLPVDGGVFIAVLGIMAAFGAMTVFRRREF